MHATVRYTIISNNSTEDEQTIFTKESRVLVKQVDVSDK